LSAIRLGMVAEWYWVTWLGIIALGAEIGVGLAVIVWPRHKLLAALVGAILLPLVLCMAVAIEVARTHNRIKTTIEPLPSASSQEPQPPPAADRPGG
jgi:hypothetical protein